MLSTKGKLAAMLVTAVLCVGVIAVMGASNDNVEAEGDTFTIQYVVEGTTYSYTGSEASVVLKSIEDIGAAIPAGKQMDGWGYLVGDTPVMVGVGSAVVLSADAPTTFTAKLSDVKYTVVFKDGDTVVSTADYTYNATLVAPADPVKAGYTFAGWDTDVADKVTEDATYNATWTGIYSVKWIVEGVNVATGSTENVSAYNIPADPVKDFFRFLGWVDDNGVKYSAEYIFESDTVFTAGFAAEVYTVTFVYGEDKEVYLTETVRYGDKAIMPAGMPAGYSGWDFNFNDKIVEDTEIVAVASAAPAPAFYNTPIGQCAIIIAMFLLGLLVWAIYTGKLKLIPDDKGRKI